MGDRAELDFGIDVQDGNSPATLNTQKLAKLLQLIQEWRTASLGVKSFQNIMALPVSSNMKNKVPPWPHLPAQVSGQGQYRSTPTIDVVTSNTIYLQKDLLHDLFCYPADVFSCLLRVSLLPIRSRPKANRHHSWTLLHSIGQQCNLARKPEIILIFITVIILLSSSRTFIK